jgi:hypothetical protein
MRKMQRKINNFDFKVTNIYRAARKQQGTVKRRSFYIDETEVSPSEWATARMEGLETYVSNASVKGNIPRLVNKRGFNRKGFACLKGKNYVVKPIDDVEVEVVELDEILEIVPELV